MLWLIYMYIFGAYIKRFGFFKAAKRIKLLFYYLISSIIVILSFTIITIVTLKILSEIRFREVFLKANSQFIIFNSIILIEIFKGLEFKGNTILKIISVVSSVSFGLYLIHDNPIISANFVSNKAIPLLNYNALYIIFIVIIISLVIYVICGCIEFLRIKIFKLLK